MKKNYEENIVNNILNFNIEIKNRKYTQKITINICLILNFELKKKF